MQKGKLVSEETVQTLTSPKPELNSSGFSYGFMVKEKGNDIEVGYDGGFTGISAIQRILKRSGYSYAILSNHSNGIDLVWVQLYSISIG